MPYFNPRQVEQSFLVAIKMLYTAVCTESNNPIILWHAYILPCEWWSLARKQIKFRGLVVVFLHNPTVPTNTNSYIPAKIVSPFLPTAPLQYAPRIRFTRATIDWLTTNKTKNVLHKEMVILNHIGGNPISYRLSNQPFVNVLQKVLCTKRVIKFCRVAYPMYSKCIFLSSCEKSWSCNINHYRIGLHFRRWKLLLSYVFLENIQLVYVMSLFELVQGFKTV